MLHTPVIAGSYKLVYDLQQQRVTFASQGTTPLTLSATLTPSLPKTYYFAEGYTGTGTTEYLSLTNPSVNTAHVSITFLYSHGSPQTRIYTVAAQSHTVLNINNEVGSNQTISMIVQSDAPFAAERTMYTHKGSFTAATDSVGSVSLSSNWYFGAGNTVPGFNERLVLTNPSASTATASIHYLTGNGQTLAQTVSVPALSRIEVNVNATIITASSPIIAARHDYFATNLNGSVSGNTVMMGASSLHTGWYLAAGDTTSGHAQSLALANPNGTATQVQVVYYLSAGAPVVKTYTLNANSRLTVNVTSDVGTNATVGVVVCATVPIVTEQEMFFNVGGNTGGFASLGLAN